MQYGSLGLPYPVSLILVLEMTHSCAKHGDAAFVRFLHRIFIADTSSRLNDGLYAIFRSEGYLMALLSLVIGVALGVGLALVQQTLGLVRLNTETLMIDAYPVELHLVDVVLTIVAYASIAWLIIRFTVRGTLSKK